MVETILLVAINAKYIHSNLAVHSLKAYSKEYAEKIQIAEYTINNLIEDILDDIYLKKPDVLAFSCYIWNIEYVEKLMVELKKLLPDTDIWLGGPEVSYNAQKYFEEFDCVKGVMVSEGEETFKDIVTNYVNGNDDFESIAGIITKDKPIADVRKCVDMSKIPFPYENLKEFENRIIYYESSRGCPFSCSYCLSSIDKTLRFRSLEQVFEELKFFMDNKVSQVKFIDRTFNCDKNRSEKIWQYILENDNGITNFHFEISADLITEEQIEILNKMRPGLVQLEIGVQSTNEKTIEAIRRKMDLERLKNVVSKIKSARNIHLHLDLIAGLPYEDIATFKKSFNDVYAMEPDELQLGFLKVLHGAYMYDDAKEYGIVYKNFPPYEVLYTKWLSFDDVLKLKKIETVLEIYYGSNQFRNTVNYLISFFESPYDFYEVLGDFYDEVHKKGEKHSRIERYNLLLDFVKKVEGANEEVLKEVMTLDIYLRENMKTRPSFSVDMSAYKDALRVLVKDGTIKKTEHIEAISLEVAKAYLDIECCENCEKIFVKFDYDNRNPITFDASVSIVGKAVENA
ncbi:MAG: DUF4080 domain-containing protein [Lachnospiraceae bacterium]|nr:DUF4080 domain-containing protein [Lachnospiraceae bacterium]